MDQPHLRIDQKAAGEHLRSVQESGVLSASNTHFLFHDLPRMCGRLEQLASAFPKGTLHALAVKANPLVEVLRVAVEAGAGLEAASIEEVHLALAAGCEAQKIVFDSPAKTNREIEEALQIGVLLNANSLCELERIDAFQPLASDRPSKIGLRVNTQVGGGRISHTSVAKAGGKFGVPLTQQDEILTAFAKYPWLVGLHSHVGSQGCGFDLLVEAIKRIVDLGRTIEEATQRELEFLDIGGGLPTTYRGEEELPDKTLLEKDESATSCIYDRYAAQLQKDVPSLFQGAAQIITEFGRSIQAGCGIAFSRIEYLRDQGATCLVHLGADFLLRPVYCPQDWQHEFFVFDGDGFAKTGETRPTAIAGPLCFGGDFIGRDVLLPTLEVGNWLAIRDVGAYTLSMWSRHCSRGLPPVVGIDSVSQRPSVLFQGENVSDVVNFWSAPVLATSPAALATSAG